MTPSFNFSLKESKVLRTVPLLAACLPPDKCTVKIGRRFSEERDIELSTVCRDSGTLILYPGAEATNLEEFILDSPVYPSTIIIIDGTWSQAKDIFYKNSLFRLPKQHERRKMESERSHGAPLKTDARTLAASVATGLAETWGKDSCRKFITDKLSSEDGMK
ncbi:DTW domain-containing protein 2 [Microtus ochrogaster]|uniref:tRNA-uridine aminocarboxypropyltransferase n=1 Tax=Microtus ochrogaster TaxID=79684 RepID=A0A8J6FYP1_MICOH|nr:DTW domain-containing protein 2 [Microtus ochrogaster]